MKRRRQRSLPSSAAVLRIAVIGIAALGLLVPAAASAQCGGETNLPPTGDLGDGRAPLAVGDSVMLGAIEPIRRARFEVDVAGCRLWSQGLELLKERARGGTLPDLVVIGLGRTGRSATTTSTPRSTWSVLNACSASSRPVSSGASRAPTR